MNDKKIAFTLAEVLITLGVVGIVAAMTLPNLIQNVQKHVLKTSIKKNYSILSQAYESLKFENGTITPNSDSAIVNSEFNNEMLKRLKIIDVCSHNALAKGCITKYQGLNTIPTACPAFSEQSVYNLRTVYVLADGSFIIPYDMDWRSLWLVDVNGKKGPNKAGFDLFEVAFDSSDERIQYRGHNCLNQESPTPKGILTDFKYIDNW